MKAAVLCLFLSAFAVAQTAKATTVYGASYKENAYKNQISGTQEATSGDYAVDISSDCPKGWKVDAVYNLKDQTYNQYMTADWLSIGKKIGYLDDASWSLSDSTLTIGYKSGYSSFGIRYVPWTYAIAYDNNGGSGTMTSTTNVRYTDAVTLSACTFSRTGYAFAGWMKSKTGSSVDYEDKKQIAAESGATLGVSKDGDTVTLYAKWSPVSYKISYDENDGTAGSSRPGEATYDAAFKVSAPTKTGYVFKGWLLSGYDSSTSKYGSSATTCTSSISSSDDIVSTTGDVYFKNLATTAEAEVTLTAVWETVKTTVTFDRDSGSGGDSSVVLSYGAASGSTKITPPTRTGYGFGGYWTGKNGSGTQCFDASGKLVVDWKETSAITLYAYWTANSCTVTFNANGGSVSTTSKSYTYGSTYGTLPTPTRDYKYVFAGWFTASSGGTKVTQSSTVTASTTLYAHWNNATYTIRFDGNDATSGATSEMTLEFNKSYSLNANGFSRSGYSFAGWATSKNGSKTYSNCQSGIQDLATSANATVTLYAVWTFNGYTIRFHANNGTEDTADQVVEMNASTTLNENSFSRTGYTFRGWGEAATATSIWYSDRASIGNLTSSVGSTVHLYAVWKANTYYVAFDANGGSGAMPMLTNTYDVAFSLPENAFAAPANAAFGGWRDDVNGAAYAAGATVSNLTATAGGTNTLQAVWTSTLTELSKAMDCTTLSWSNAYSATTSPIQWEVCETTGYESTSCARQENGSPASRLPMFSELSAVASSNSAAYVKGTMSFMWKPSSESAKLNWGMSGGSYPKSWESVKATGMDWQKVSVSVSFQVESSLTAYFYLDNVTPESEGTYECIDQMTWTPETAGDAPVAGRDEATISGFAPSTDEDGTPGWTLTFSGDAKFAYRVLYKDALTDAAWTVDETLAPTVGSDGVSTLIIPRDDSTSQRFFKIETIQK